MRPQFHINMFSGNLSSSLYGGAREIKKIRFKLPLSMEDGEKQEKKLETVKHANCLLLVQRPPIRRKCCPLLNLYPVVCGMIAHCAVMVHSKQHKPYNESPSEDSYGS